MIWWSELATTVDAGDTEVNPFEACNSETAVAIYNLQFAICNLQSAICNLQFHDCHASLTLGCRTRK